MTTQVQQLNFDRARTVIIIMDFNQPIVDGYSSDPKGVVLHAAAVLKAARQAKVPVIYVVPSGPTMGAGNIHPGVAPVQGETIVQKSRIGAFSTTGLDSMLRQQGKDTIVLMGVATSGCVLSTARWGFDAGYKQIIISDGCSDPDPAVHQMLTQPTGSTKSMVSLGRMGQLSTAAEFERALA